MNAEEARKAGVLLTLDDAAAKMLAEPPEERGTTLEMPPAIRERDSEFLFRAIQLTLPALPELGETTSTKRGPACSRPLMGSNRRDRYRRAALSKVFRGL